MVRVGQEVADGRAKVHPVHLALLALIGHVDCDTAIGIGLVQCKGGAHRAVDGGNAEAHGVAIGSDFAHGLFCHVGIGLGRHFVGRKARQFHLRGESGGEAHHLLQVEAHHLRGGGLPLGG